MICNVQRGLRLEPVGLSGAWSDAAEQQVLPSLQRPKMVRSKHAAPLALASPPPATWLHASRLSLIITVLWLVHAVCVIPCHGYLRSWLWRMHHRQHLYLGRRGTWLCGNNTLTCLGPKHGGLTWLTTWQSCTSSTICPCSIWHPCPGYFRCWLRGMLQSNRHPGPFRESWSNGSCPALWSLARYVLSRSQGEKFIAYLCNFVSASLNQYGSVQPTFIIYPIIFQCCNQVHSFLGRADPRALCLSSFVFSTTCCFGQTAIFAHMHGCSDTMYVFMSCTAFHRAHSHWSSWPQNRLCIRVSNGGWVIYIYIYIFRYR